MSLQFVWAIERDAHYCWGFCEGRWEPSFLSWGIPAPDKEGAGWEVSFRAGSVGTTAEGEERSLRQPSFFFFLPGGGTPLSITGPQSVVMALWHEAQSSTVSQLQLLWQLSSVSRQYLLLFCQQVQPILSMLIDEPGWFVSGDRLEADALAGTRLLWPTLLQKQLQRAEVLVGLAVPEGSRNSEWALAWTISVCLTAPSDASVILECCQNTFQPKETEKWNNRGLTLNVSTQQEWNFPGQRYFFTPGAFPCAEHEYLLPKNGGVIPYQRRVTKILCKGKG